MIDGLRRALRDRGSPLADAPLEVMADTGLAHHHVRLVGSGRLARVPKQSQLGLAPDEHLRYEAACFERAAGSGHVPVLHDVVPPCPGLDHGALVVDEIRGRPLRLPGDLTALVQALAALHALPLPPAEARAPLIDPPDPVAALIDEIEGQCRWIGDAGIDATARRRIDGEFRRLVAEFAAGDRPARHLIAFDAHPGNFVVDGRGRAVLVDLEKARYGAASVDLAHATAYTSTTWDLHTRHALDPAQLRHASDRWLGELERRGIDADRERRWIVPMRRAMALWSLSWCAKWRALSQRPRAAGGEDWSSSLSDDTLVRHVRERVDHYLSPAVVARVFDDADALAGQR